MRCSTPWVGVGITSPMHKMEGNFRSKHFTYSGTGSDHFALELDSFGDESPRGNLFSIWSLEKGTRWVAVGRTRYNAKCFSSINQKSVICQSSVRKIKPTSAGKCMVLAAACAGIAAEPVKARRLFSFLTSCKVLHNC
jgi:hypothetical protein